MVYDAVEMLKLRRALADAIGTKAATNVIRLCDDLKLQPAVIQEFLRLGIKEGRNALIVELNKKQKVSLRRLGFCFGLSHERVRQILKKAGRKSRIRSGPKGTWGPILESLDEEKVKRVMRRVATDPRFWNRKGKLKVSLVLEALGFQQLSRHLVTKVWRAVVERFNLETRKVGIIIIYRLGEDPYEFLRSHYHSEGMRLPELAEVINRGGRVKVSHTEVGRYMGHIGVPTLGRGRRDEAL